MTVTIHTAVEQGSDEWHALRCGILTASEMKHAITAKTLKTADNESARAHVWELAAQRISQYVEPTYIGDDMLRGWSDEILARAKYEEVTGQTVEEVGFITNDKWGFTIGYSPDGLVGDEGLLECKSRRQKYQVQTIVEWHRNGSVPTDYAIQLQTGLMVSEREWIDLVSYSGGLRMPIMRVQRDEKVIAAIEEAAAVFEAKVVGAVADYKEASVGMVLTERKVEQEMYV